MTINKIYFDTVKKLYGEDNANAFFKELEAVGKRLGINPEWISNVIWIESKFKATAQNPYSSATGLIQWVNKTAEIYGINRDKLLKMTNIEQLKYVELYLKNHFKLIKPKDWFDVYFSVFWPAFINKSDDYKALMTPNQYNANKSIDLNKDGTLTKGEFKRWANKQLPKSLQIGLSTTPEKKT